ncbi:Protein serine/threonine phosphatase PrpC, regulation of stationary phase [hydrothermal vent metagenome]|uniref:Protein serine/threonine phosphatase PrpC, regulation of stationary phase n=1 Tax=hydrothermal vent metagenome TaxID=652676 RepID=A0A1W1D290_9ZZZZ
MAITNIKTSGFSLAKRDDLTGDDFYDIQTIDNLVVAIVCDGVGSASEGAQAAKRVTTNLMRNFKTRPKSWSIEKSIRSFIQSINSILYQESILNYDAPEIVTTLALVVIQGNRLYGANVGDSRIYIQRNNTLKQLSFDHVMDEKGYENVLTQAIGIEKEVDIYYFENNITKGDKILLCSDGLYNTLDEKTLAKDIEFGANFLVKKASKKANDYLLDDTTAVVLDIVENNEIAILKSLELPIPKTLKAKDNIDGYILQKPLIQNKRTWLCQKDNQDYVIKFPPLEAIDDANILELFIKEVWNAKRLQGDFFPNVIIPNNRSMRYYVMEAIQGTTLKNYLKQSTLHIEDSITLAKTLLKMEQYLIRLDLVHGDIKPENIMVVKKGDKLSFKVIDFGSIKEVFSIDSIAGTPSYLAPERFNGATINESTEIFAIGVTLYESLTKHYPYGEIEPFQIPTFHPPKPAIFYNQNIPDWLNSILLRSIASDEDMRYKNYSEMMYELENTHQVKPFIQKELPLLQRNPLRTYQIGFYLMLFFNLYLLLK